MLNCSKLWKMFALSVGNKVTAVQESASTRCVLFSSLCLIVVRRLFPRQDFALKGKSSFVILPLGNKSIAKQQIQSN